LFVCVGSRVKTRRFGSLQVSDRVKQVIKAVKDVLKLRTEEDALVVLLETFRDLLRCRNLRHVLYKMLNEAGTSTIHNVYKLKVDCARCLTYGLGHLLSKVDDVDFDHFMFLSVLWIRECREALEKLRRAGINMLGMLPFEYIEAVLDKIERDLSTFVKVLYFGAPSRYGIWEIVDVAEFHDEKTIKKIRCTICNTELFTCRFWDVYRHFCVEEWDKIKDTMSQLFV